MRKIKWLVQDVGLSIQNTHQEFLTLQKLNFSYAGFGLIPFTERITNLENVLADPEEGFIIRGGTKILTLLEKLSSLRDCAPELSEYQLSYSGQYLQQLKSAIFYNEKNFDQYYYSSLGLPLLNERATYCEIEDNLHRTWNYPVFMKPSLDQKSFTAAIVPPGMSVLQCIESQPHQSSYIKEKICVAPVREISREYRFFVVCSQVITGSLYKCGSQVVTSPEIPQDILECARSYARLYCPHDVFTMDLCVCDKGIKIVEYNCWNASGLYKTDVNKIFLAVQDYKLEALRKLKFKSDVHEPGGSRTISTFKSAGAS